MLLNLGKPLHVSLVFILTILTWKLNAFVLKSASSAPPSFAKGSTVRPFRLPSGSKNGLNIRPNIRTGLPRGVMSLIAPAVERGAVTVKSILSTVATDTTTTMKFQQPSTVDNQSTFSSSTTASFPIVSTSSEPFTTTSPEEMDTTSVPETTSTLASSSIVPNVTKVGEITAATTQSTVVTLPSTQVPSVSSTEKALSTTDSSFQTVPAAPSTETSSVQLTTGTLSTEPTSTQPATSTSTVFVSSTAATSLPSSATLSSVSSTKATSIFVVSTSEHLKTSTASALSKTNALSSTATVVRAAPRSGSFTDDLVQPATSTVSTQRSFSTTSFSNLLSTAAAVGVSIIGTSTSIETSPIASTTTSTPQSASSSSSSSTSTIKQATVPVTTETMVSTTTTTTTESTTPISATTSSTKPNVTVEVKKANTSSTVDIITVPSSSESTYSSTSSTTSTQIMATSYTTVFPTTTTLTTTTPTTTTTTVPEPCDRSVVSLLCTPPNFDKTEVFGKCSWDAFTQSKRVDSAVSYKIAIRELTGDYQNQVKIQVTNSTTYIFPVRPGQQYEIIVNWLYLNADDSDMSDCKLSTFILAVPYERPKLQVDPEWLIVNMTLSTIFIRNPFYQLQTALVSRLSIDLALPQKNSFIFCEPAYWNSVQLSEGLSCEIVNLSNDTIDELSITLNATGDPSGKDPNSFAFTRQTVVFDASQRNRTKIDATVATPSSSPVVDNAAAAGGGAAAGVVVGAALVVLLIFLVRRHRKNTPKQTWQANVSMPPGLALGDDAFVSTQNLSHSTFISGPITADKFAAYVASLERNSGLGYASLWEDVRLIGLQQTTDVAELPANRLKNRFTNVLPYDDSRVKLLPWPVSALSRKEKEYSNDDTPDGEIPYGDDSDYVNASFIPGLWSDHEYIATQGPLPATIRDFWRTIWQQRVCAIVMLTKLKEGGVRKCESYWPPNVDSDAGEYPFGPLNIQLVSQSDEILSPVLSSDRDHFGFENSQENTGVWTIRDFRISLPSDDGTPSQIRTLRQYQFNAWPDQGVPSGRNRSNLLRFVRLVRSQVDRSSGKVVEPIVVHCSAGVGRSGAFIAMDILLQDLAAGRPIDVTGVVRKLREYRQLVQTEQQFRFIHELLLEAINGKVVEGNGVDVENKNTALSNNGNGLETAVAPSRRNKGKANTAFEDDDVQTSELDDRV